MVKRLGRGPATTTVTSTSPTSTPTTAATTIIHLCCLDHLFRCVYPEAKVILAIFWVCSGQQG